MSDESTVRVDVYVFLTFFVFNDESCGDTGAYEQTYSKRQQAKGGGTHGETSMREGGGQTTVEVSECRE